MAQPPDSGDTSIKAAIERSRQRREESMRRGTDENKKRKAKPSSKAGRPGAPATTRRQASTSPDLKEAPKEKRRKGGGPDLIAEPKRRKGGGPEMIVEAERKKGGAPEMILEAERKKSAGPEMVLEPERKKGGAPELVEEAARRKGGAAELVEGPRKRKGGDPEMIEVPQRGASRAEGAAGGEAPDADDAQRNQAHEAVATLARQLEGSLGRQGGGWNIDQTDPLTLSLTSGARSLTLRFRTVEAIFDTLQIIETRTVEKPKKRGSLLSGLGRLFRGRSEAGEDEEVERRMVGRNPGADGRSFDWESLDDEEEFETGAIVASADYFDGERHQELDISLSNSGAAGGGLSPLTPGGAVRAVNAVFAGLKAAL